ncbi:hypothetical protein [Raoultibacter massiliensis]|uniref:Uncharacterized protein n=1 Tax=Raoultibacter massiliensis TaxID=1852371 RepID=A0ABV1J925_9ACTN|nr:hypothetical protein [Raoultibacter massiliensis]
MAYEHDPLASCYLVTFSESYADAVEPARKLVRAQIAATQQGAANTQSTFMSLSQRAVKRQRAFE